MRYRVLYDFALNAADLYPAQVQMARDNASERTWTDYVKHAVLRRYRVDCREPYEGMSKDEIVLVACALRDYYTQHIQEMEQ